MRPERAREKFPTIRRNVELRFKDVSSLAEHRRPAHGARNSVLRYSNPGRSAMTTDPTKSACCASDPGPEKIQNPCPACPACGVRGKSVKAVTLHALVTQAAVERAATLDGFRFCASTECEIAYYQTETDDRILRGELRVRIGQKETSAPRPVCYCFEHTLEDIQADMAATGDSTIPDSITAKCKQGLDRCETKNPQGTCCLGNVRAAMRAAREASGGQR